MKAWRYQKDICMGYETLCWRLEHCRLRTVDKDCREALISDGLPLRLRLWRRELTVEILRL